MAAGRAIGLGAVLVATGLIWGSAWGQGAAPQPSPPPQPPPTTTEDAELAAAAVRNMREEKWREAARAYQDSLGPDAPRGSAGLCCHPTPYGTEWCH